MVSKKEEIQHLWPCHETIKITLHPTSFWTLAFALLLSLCLFELQMCQFTQEEMKTDESQAMIR